MGLLFVFGRKVNHKNIISHYIFFSKKDGVTEATVSNNLIVFIFNNMISGYFFEIFQDIVGKKVIIS